MPPLVVVVVLGFLLLQHVSADCPATSWLVNYTYLGCTSNSINIGCGQQQWGGFDSGDPTINLHSLIQTPAAPLVLSGNGVLHMDNAIIDTGFGFQPKAQPAVPLDTWAGAVELSGLTDPASAPYGGDTFEFSFDFFFVSPVADGFFMSLSLWSDVAGSGGGGDRDTYLAFENTPVAGPGPFNVDGARLYTADGGSLDNAAAFAVQRRVWYHLRYRCTFNGSPVLPDPCQTFINGTLVLNSTSWKILQHSGVPEPHNYLEFRMSRPTSQYGLLSNETLGIQIDNYNQQVYNLSLPSKVATNYSTGFEVCATNVDGCQQYASLIQNGGTCVLPGGTAVGSNGQFTVLCPAGFAGTYCQLVADACSSSPCMNGGTCVLTNRNADFACNCTAAYNGTTCQNLVNFCAINNGGCGVGRVCSMPTGCGVCRAGYHEPIPAAPDCIPCSAGSYTSLPSNATTCTLCTNGTYNNAAASTTCRTCLPPSQQPTPGSTYCFNCTVGRYGPGCNQNSTTSAAAHSASGGLSDITSVSIVLLYLACAYFVIPDGPGIRRPPATRHAIPTPQHACPTRRGVTATPYL